MSVTIKDIAKEVGVSHITVSRALNNNSNVTAATKARVMEVARRLNYTPNMNAKSLVLKRSFTIGLFFTSISKGNSPEIFYQLVEKCNRDINKDYNIIVKGIDNLNSINQIAQTNFDGIILFSQSSKDASFIQEVKDRNIPLVVMNKQTEGIYSVSFNEQRGGYIVLKELLKNNHRRIAFLMGNESSASTASRLKGYTKCLEEYNISMENCIFRYGDYSYDHGYKIAKDLIAAKSEFTAICCQNDDMAVGAIKAIKEMGLSVPGNISICGYDGTKVASMFDPSITTVRRPILLALQLAMTKLFDLINGNDPEGNKHIMLEPELIDGKSIKRIQ